MSTDLLTRQRAYRAKELLEGVLKDMNRPDKDVHKLSVMRAFHAASQGRYQHAAPAEYEQWGCVDSNPQRFVIPFAYLAAVAMRDLTAANSGSLTGSKTNLLALPLIGSGLAQAGANFVPNVQRDQIYPKITTKPPFAWLASESASVPTDSTMTLGQTVATPKRGGISLATSPRITLQAQDFDGTMEHLVTQLAHDAMDAGGLNGSGAAGQPGGALTNASIPAVSGATMNVDGLSTMEELAVANDANDSALTWFASPDTRRILRQRELSTGGGSIWSGSDLLGHPARVTSKMPAASLLIGDFSQMDVLLFGAGVEVLVDPFSNFKSGAITFQLSVAMDIVINYPAAFRKCTTIS